MLAIRSLRTVASTKCLHIAKSSFHSAGALQAKVAVVLSGCGVYDGTEVHDASACLVHLSRSGAEVGMFAPDVPQAHVINHIEGAPDESDKRNVLQESARIARGAVKALPDLKTSDFDALIFPGGFGAAKNLSSFAFDGADMKLNGDVERVVKEFHAANKPMGFICIAPTIAAKLIPGVEVTVGSDQEEGGRYPHAGTAGAITSMGGTHIKKNVSEAHVDMKNKVVTSPAFMCQTAVHEIFDGIGEMVKNVLKLVK